MREIEYQCNLIAWLYQSYFDLNFKGLGLENAQSLKLGFLVLRPLDIATFGRTVLAWYKNTELSNLRVNTGVREYTCNISGLK